MKKNKILLILLIVICLTFSFSTAALANNLIVTVLNVGQADCSLIQFPNGKTMLIDAGLSDINSENNIIKFIKNKNINNIDIFIVTHPHADHMGGAIAILNNFNINTILDDGLVTASGLQKRYYQAIKNTNGKIKFVVVKSGYNIDMDNVSINILAPNKILTGTPSDANNNSIVTYIKYNNISFLFPGDMEEDERHTIINTIPPVTVLKAAHHGSRNGTDKQLLSLIKPKYIVFSYGIGNEYKHPHKQVIKLLEQFNNIIRLDTPNGNITFITDGNVISAEQNGRKY